MGATPIDPGEDPRAEAMAGRAARIAALAARHSKRGLRAYFFALAALAWFLHPVLFMGTNVYVLFVLYRREFRSRSQRALKGDDDDLGQTA